MNPNPSHDPSNHTPQRPGNVSEIGYTSSTHRRNKHIPNNKLGTCMACCSCFWCAAGTHGNATCCTKILSRINPTHNTSSRNQPIITGDSHDLIHLEEHLEFHRGIQYPAKPTDRPYGSVKVHRRGLLQNQPYQTVE